MRDFQPKMCLESFCCLGCSVGSTRAIMRYKFKVNDSDCDLACICGVVIACMCFRRQARQLAYAMLIGCMFAQQDLELRIEEQKRIAGGVGGAAPARQVMGSPVVATVPYQSQPASPYGQAQPQQTYQPQQVSLCAHLLFASAHAPLRERQTNFVPSLSCLFRSNTRSKATEASRNTRSSRSEISVAMAMCHNRESESCDPRCADWFVLCSFLSLAIRPTSTIRPARAPRIRRTTSICAATSGQLTRRDVRCSIRRLCVWFVRLTLRPCVCLLCSTLLNLSMAPASRSTRPSNSTVSSSSTVKRWLSFELPRSPPHPRPPAPTALLVRSHPRSFLPALLAFTPPRRSPPLHPRGSMRVCATGSSLSRARNRRVRCAARLPVVNASGAALTLFCTVTTNDAVSFAVPLTLPASVERLASYRGIILRVLFFSFVLARALFSLCEAPCAPTLVSIGPHPKHTQQRRRHASNFHSRAAAVLIDQIISPARSRAARIPIGAGERIDVIETRDRAGAEFE